MRKVRQMDGLAVVLLSMLACAVAGAETAKPSAELRITQDQVHWAPNPALPAGVRMAVLYGDIRRQGLFVLQVSFPPHTRLPVHSHPDERIRTIIAGTYYSAVGDVYDAQALQAYPPGTVSNVPADVWQFAESRDEPVVFQIIGIGPTGIKYLSPADDPRSARR